MDWRGRHPVAVSGLIGAFAGVAAAVVLSLAGLAVSVDGIAALGFIGALIGLVLGVWTDRRRQVPIDSDVEGVSTDWAWGVATGGCGCVMIPVVVALAAGLLVLVGL